MSGQKFSFYFSAFGESCITLPKRLSGLQLIFAMYHELGHHFHAGDDPRVAWHGMIHDRDEIEADAVAAVALIPISRIGQIDFLDGSRFARKLYEDRMKLYFLYGV